MKVIFSFSLPQCFHFSTDVPLLTGLFSQSTSLSRLFLLDILRIVFNLVPFIVLALHIHQNALFSCVVGRSALTISQSLMKFTGSLNLVFGGARTCVNFRRVNVEKSKRMVQICITNFYDFLNSTLQLRLGACVGYYLKLCEENSSREIRISRDHALEMLLVSILMRMLRQATQTRFTIEIIHVNFIPNIQHVSPSSSPPTPVLTSHTSETSTIHIGFNTSQTRRSC